MEIRVATESKEIYALLMVFVCFARFAPPFHPSHPEPEQKYCDGGNTADVVGF